MTTAIAPTPVASDWRTQQYYIPRTFESPAIMHTLADVAGGKFYHASVNELPIGTMLVPGYPKNFRQSSKKVVSITSVINLARHWGIAAAKGNPWFLYEVEPIGMMTIWRDYPAINGKSFSIDEGRVTAARIVAVLSCFIS